MAASSASGDCQSQPEAPWPRGRCQCQWPHHCPQCPCAVHGKEVSTTDMFVEECSGDSVDGPPSRDVPHPQAAAPGPLPLLRASGT